MPGALDAEIHYWPDAGCRCIDRLLPRPESAAGGPVPSLAGQLMIDDARPQVHCLEGGREINFGGIGKGYALDVMAELCRQWGIPAGLLCAGASTQLAFGNSPWPISLRGDQSLDRGFGGECPDRGMKGLATK